MAAVTSINLSDLLGEYFRTKLHPRCADVIKRYPHLWSNDNIRSKLLTKYPSSRMSDNEYHQFWQEQLNMPSIFTKLTFTKGFK
jgi:hypothetical protein